MVTVWYGFHGGTYTSLAGGGDGLGWSHLIPERDIADVRSRKFLCFWGLYTRGKSKVVGFKCAMTEEKHEWVVSTGGFSEKCRHQNSGGSNVDPCRSHCRHESVWSPCEHKRQCHQQRYLCCPSFQVIQKFCFVPNFIVRRVGAGEAAGMSGDLNVGEDHDRERKHVDKEQDQPYVGHVTVQVTIPPDTTGQSVGLQLIAVPSDQRGDSPKQTKHPDTDQNGQDSPSLYPGNIIVLTHYLIAEVAYGSIRHNIVTSKDVTEKTVHLAPDTV